VKKKKKVCLGYRRPHRIKFSDAGYYSVLNIKQFLACGEVDPSQRSNVTKSNLTSPDQT
jgi:hypothetical protein